MTLFLTTRATDLERETKSPTLQTLADLPQVFHIMPSMLRVSAPTISLGGFPWQPKSIHRLPGVLLLGTLDSGYRRPNSECLVEILGSRCKISWKAIKVVGRQMPLAGFAICKFIYSGFFASLKKHLQVLENIGREERI